MRSALSAKLAAGQLIVIDELAADGKTSSLKVKLDKLGVTNALIVGGSEVDSSVSRAAANLPHIDILPTQGANVYDIIRRDMLVLSRDAVVCLEERLK